MLEGSSSSMLMLKKQVKAILYFEKALGTAVTGLKKKRRMKAMIWLGLALACWGSRHNHYSFVRHPVHCSLTFCSFPAWNAELRKALELSQYPVWCTLDGKIKEVNPRGNNPEYSLEGLMLKLKLQYYGHLMWRTDSLEKTLMLGKIEGGRRWDDRR